MEENPSTPRRRPPRARSARAAFSTPEQDQPEADPAPRPRRSKAAPAVTFQPPEPSAAEAEPARKPPSANPDPPAGAAPAKKATPAKEASPAKRANPAEEATPAKRATPAKEATPVEKTAPATGATPAKRVASAKKAAPSRKTAPSKKAAPVKAPPPPPEVSPEPIPASPPAEPTADPPPPSILPVRMGLPPRTEWAPEIWSHLVADPGHAPELLALAAVHSIGPRAHEWARHVRDSYPAATGDAVARLATRQFTRLGGLSSSLAAIAGSYAPIALAVTSALTHAQLVLHIAAAYGVDPRSHDRAADLLVLTRVHGSRAEADRALHVAQQPAYADGGVTGAAGRLGRMAGTAAAGWTALRIANRLLPGVSLLAATLGGRSAAEAVAARATMLYRNGPPGAAHSQDSQSLGSNV
ncbi:hypothetical protein [Mangrovihabitans endophyticus]|nr:hypothetical protein [Mangrovihabitans endophyticus]